MSSTGYVLFGMQRLIAIMLDDTGIFHSQMPWYLKPIKHATLSES